MQEYTVIPSKRKSMGIIIDNSGTVTIRVPHHTPQTQINTYIIKYQSWINKKLEQISQRNKLIILNNNEFYYHGKSYPIKKVISSDQDYIYFDGLFLLVHTSIYHNIHQLLPHWYKCMTYAIVKSILTNYCKNFNLKYNNFTITHAETRLGSCSSTGNICFSYKLVKLAPHVIQYVVAHELSHLKHMNHSKQFWQHVEKLDPEYKMAIKWLKENQHIVHEQIYSTRCEI